MTGAAVGLAVAVLLLCGACGGAAATTGSGVAAGSPTATAQPAVRTCRTDQVAPGLSVGLCVQVPAPADRGGQRLRVSASVQIAGQAPPVNGITYSLDGGYLLFDPQQPYSFQLHSYLYARGAHTLSASVEFSGGLTSPVLDIPLDLPNPPKAPPPPSPFRPTAGAPPGAGQPFVVGAVGDGASGLTAESQVVDLIGTWHPSLFLYLGDVYRHGAPEEYLNWYGEAGRRYDRFRSITDPTLGNHEFESDSAGTPWSQYWGDPPPYYSVDTHGWHLIVLDDVGPSALPGTDSAQYRWLASDLAAHPNPCTLVTYHRPRFSEGQGESAPDFDAYWRLLAAHHVPLVLNGHSHNYQRWNPLDANGAPVTTDGTTEIVVGTGGQWTSPLGLQDPRVAKASASDAAWGALRLQLSATKADFSYVTIDGETQDAGSVPCAGH